MALGDQWWQFLIHFVVVSWLMETIQFLHPDVNCSPVVALSDQWIL